MSIWAMLGMSALHYGIAAGTNAKVKRIAISERNKTLGAAAQANDQNRNLIVAENFSNIEMLVPENGMCILPTQPNSARLAISDPSDQVVNNTVLSGANAFVRNRALMPIIADTCAKNIPIIMLHCSNQGIEKDLRAVLPASRILAFNSQSTSYNPFKGLSLNEAVQLVFQSIPRQKYGVGAMGRDFIRVMMDILIKQGLTVDFQRLVTCPHNNLLPVIQKKATGNFIMRADAVNLESDLMASQMESRSIAHYFQDLEPQIRHISNCAIRDASSESLMDGLLARKVMLLDIRVNTNTLLVDLIVNQLKNIFTSGAACMIILDGVGLSLNQDLLQIMIQNPNCRFVLSYDDMYASLNSDEKIFMSAMGGVQKTVVYNHPSPMSCTHWSKYFGEFDKHEPETTHNQNMQGGAMPGQSSGSALRVVRKREARILPEMINHLYGNEACIYDSNSKAIFVSEVV